MLSNLKMSTQLYAAFALVLLLMVIVAITAYSGLNNGYSNFKEYRGLATDSNLASQLDAEMLKIRLSSFEYLKKDSPAILAEYESHIQKMEELIAEARREIQNPARVKKYNKSSL